MTKDDSSERARASCNAYAGVESPAPISPLRIVVYPFHGPQEGVDVTDALIDTVAQMIWKLHGGDEPVNRLEARVLLEQALGRHVIERENQSRT